VLIPNQLRNFPVCEKNGDRIQRDGTIFRHELRVLIRFKVRFGLEDYGDGTTAVA